MRKKLPDDLKIKKTGYYWRPHKKARLIKLGETKKEAAKVFNDLRDSKEIRPPEESFGAIMERVKRTLYHSMSKRASSKKIKALTRDEFEVIWERSGGKCELTGIEFSFQRPFQSLRRPWSPSLDRKDASIGYTPENCRLVCTAVNIALNEWGEEVLLKIANALFSERVLE